MTQNDSNELAKYFNDRETIADYLDVYSNQDGEYESLKAVPFSRFREKLILKTALRLLHDGDSVLEIGCGIGHLLNSLLAQGVDAKGIDNSESMVEQAKVLLTSQGQTPNRVTSASLFDYQPDNLFSLVIANGVICYYQDQIEFLKRVTALLTNDGAALIIHRNALFNLFALNQGTIEFIADNLLSHFPVDEREQITGDLQNTINGLQTPVQQHSNAHLYRSAENPLDVTERYAAGGLVVKQLLYTFIHPFSPRLNRKVSADLIETVQQRYENDWRGMFLGSQFLVIAEKAPL